MSSRCWEHRALVPEIEATLAQRPRDGLLLLAGWPKPMWGQHGLAWTGSGDNGFSKTSLPVFLSFIVAAADRMKGASGYGILYCSLESCICEHMWDTLGEFLKQLQLGGIVFKETRGCIRVGRKVYAWIFLWLYMYLHMHMCVCI